MTVRMNWREDAACRNADPDLFFPIGTAGNSLRQIDEAKQVCRLCPAQNQCLAWALENGITDGVWGGTTENERRAIRSLSRRKRTSKEDNDSETYHSAEHGEHEIRAQFAAAKASRIFRGTGIGPAADGTGTVATSDAATPAPLRLMTSELAPSAAAEDATRTITDHLAFLAQTRPSSAPDIRAGDGFARDFATADGERVMVAAITRQQFADLAGATRLARTFAFLERVLDADFSTCSDLYTHRDTIAALLAPWFSRCTVADLVAAFAGTSVPWAHLHDQTGRPGSRQARVPTQDHFG
jgi:WhiB family transcriptional regulator, redox-sensing transcriptional regulator